jgi:hypothetical protein
MRLAALCLLSTLALAGCASMSDTYINETKNACSAGDRTACETLATMHIQALRDADAIMAGMQQARSELGADQRAAP